MHLHLELRSAVVVQLVITTARMVPQLAALVLLVPLSRLAVALAAWVVLLEHSLLQLVLLTAKAVCLECIQLLATLQHVILAREGNSKIFQAKALAITVLLVTQGLALLHPRNARYALWVPTPWLVMLPVLIVLLETTTTRLVPTHVYHAKRALITPLLVQ